jgi:hypothetical protein
MKIREVKVRRGNEDPDHSTECHQVSAHDSDAAKFDGRKSLCSGRRYMPQNVFAVPVLAHMHEETRVSCVEKHYASPIEHIRAEAEISFLFAYPVSRYVDAGHVGDVGELFGLWRIFSKRAFVGCIYLG